MARQRGAIAGGYKCGICRERGHNAVTCPRRGGEARCHGGRQASAARLGPIGKRPALAPLAYVIDSLELRLEDYPRSRQFVVKRAWLSILLSAARRRCG